MRAGKICIYDTSICDDNLGNQIIMDAINPVIDSLFRENFIIKLQYLEKFGKTSHRHIRESQYTFFGGTNALSSQMNRYSQMGFSLMDSFRVNNVVLVGVGWWQYQKSPNFYTRTLLRRILHKDAIHSVRDKYTKTYLEAIGIKNVVNTSCPTVWNLTPELCEGIPTKKSRVAVCTLTEYNPNPKADAAFLRTVLESYEQCYLWLQGADDHRYFESLNFPQGQFTLIPPKLDAYDQILKSTELDYLGTRLHAGIRAIQHGRRSIILGIDNRAHEIGKDIGLNVCDRADTVALVNFISGNSRALKLSIPFTGIARWKSQFT